MEDRLRDFDEELDELWMTHLRRGQPTKPIISPLTRSLAYNWEDKNTCFDAGFYEAELRLVESKIEIDKKDFHRHEKPTMTHAGRAKRLSEFQVLDEQLTNLWESLYDL